MGQGVGAVSGRRPMQWLHHAACIGQDPELWYGITPHTQSDAVRICHTCPVIDACLVDALHRADQFAVLGGTTPDQRRAMRLAMAAAS